ncbi:PREDICTED: putative nuclease HARBI1, partial [Vollenhovia emeryi]|uniref:putative nuclease HARBI1 n=1 Tax=Vollenhovia emeryi TaxID=411798 RepID=UPI0005F450AB
MRARSTHFWNEIVLCTYTEAEWIESFRMRKETFNDLCRFLRPALEPKPLFLKSREPLSCEKQVALYKMASCAEYRVVGNVFGIHKSTVKKCLYRVVNAINDVMMKDYLHMPDTYEASVIAMHFEKISHIPQIIGCIDGSHIPILAPSEGCRDFVNCKGWPSYVLLAVVDDKYRFRNICIRHPGSTHDAAVFKDSSLYRDALNDTRNINGVAVPYLIVGDPAYPLLPWLLKGYPGSVTAEQESFNVHLNSARVAVEMAFSRLKARWRILLKRIDVNYVFVPHITSACCISQNFLECKKEQFLQQWLNDVVEAEVLYPQPVD